MSRVCEEGHEKDKAAIQKIEKDLANISFCNNTETPKEKHKLSPGNIEALRYIATERSEREINAFKFAALLEQGYNAEKLAIDLCDKKDRGIQTLLDDYLQVSREISPLNELMEMRDTITRYNIK